MKKQCWFGVIAFLFLCVMPSIAQCGMYTYQDIWLDDNGNAVGENYTQASCAGGSAYAEVHVTTPSGSQQGASASGASFAEAVAQAATSGQIGAGLFSGFNVVNNSCGDVSDSFSFEWPIDFDTAYTKSKWNSNTQALGLGGKRCFVDSWCTVATTPPTCNPSYIDQQPLIAGTEASCWQYYNTDWIAFRVRILGWPWECVPLIPGQNAIGTIESSLKSCTKL